MIQDFGYVRLQGLPSQHRSPFIVDLLNHCLSNKSTI